jgi:hypothetical protein
MTVAVEAGAGDSFSELAFGEVAGERDGVFGWLFAGVAPELIGAVCGDV